MALTQGPTYDTTGTLSQFSEARTIASALVRASRHAASADFAGMGPTLDLDRLLAIPLTTLDEDPRIVGDIVRQKTVLILIDAYRTRPDRSAAEVAWVQERLAHGIELLLVWPRRALGQAIQMSSLDHSRMFLDVQGDYRRLVSPSGKRIAVLVDRELNHLETVTAGNEIFDLGRGTVDRDERGSDHTIDLGDVYR